MNFLDNMVKSSNALLKDRLQNPFGSKDASQAQPSATDQEASTGQSQQPPAPSDQVVDNQITDDQSVNATSTRQSFSGTDSQFASIAADAEAVTKKAVDGAKNIGTFLFSMANKAGRHVNEAAKQVKKAVETNIMTDFTREQQEFIKDHGGNILPSELPWNCYGDESKANEMREQILSLSQDKRNFVRGPPNDSNFEYKPEDCLPIALSLLKEDPNLGKLRYELVPKLVNEDTFWRNYFYRVSLLKQFIDKGDSGAKHDWVSSRSSSGEGPDEITLAEEPSQAANIPASNISTINETRPLSNILTNNNQVIEEKPEQISAIDTASAFTTSNLIRQQTSELDDSSKLLAEADDLNSKLKELGFDYDEEIENYDQELQEELKDFELISNDLSTLEDEEDLNREIMELKLKNSKSKSRAN